MNLRDERIAKNEVLMRGANREIQQAEEVGNGSQGRFDVLCECGRDDKFGEAGQIAEDESG